MPELNYFTCTLGEAKPYRDDSFTNITDFIEQQAKAIPDYPAAGFYRPSSESNSAWRSDVFTFKDVLSRSISTANALSASLGVEGRQVVALLCPSTVEFLFTWLGLIRLGHSVLLVAPQNSSKGVAELCKQSNANNLIFDKKYEQLAKESRVEAGKDFALKLHDLPQVDLESADLHVAAGELKEAVSKDDIAYLFHTSGTSSGIPKPIPQSHYAGTGVLPRLDGSSSATFSTTPLYHGGIADLFRAWTSKALIWLFPSKDVPITAANIVQCLKTASQTKTPPIKYFASVPYVLQTMASDDVGLQHLQGMEMVSVGGSALPDDVGNTLVNEGVHLVSRFGSAECGFIMSSHRDYKEDRCWQYLRLSKAGSAFLKFEEQESGLAELIVLPDWPHMSKRNRPDGSFATSDLFERRPEIPDAWRYHSRADSQLTLTIGKSFDPAPVEAAIVARSDLLQDELVFGEQRPYPGALLFRSAKAKDLSDEELLDQVAPEVERVNAEGEAYARISRNMLIPMPHTEAPLEKSSKGTVLRSKAEERYSSEIEAAYGNSSAPKQTIPDDQVDSTITGIVRSVMGGKSRRGEELDSQTDLFAYGVDSAACLQIRHAVSALLPEKSPALPMTIVQDRGTIQQLSETILDIRNGRETRRDSHSDELALMEGLVEQYSQFHADASTTAACLKDSSKNNEAKTVLMTGATGALGSHLLARLLENSTVSRIHLLLRGDNQEAAKQRVLKVLEQRKLAAANAFQTKVVIHTCTLSNPRLGLPEEIYLQLVEEVDVLYHLAWAVDFILPLNAFKQHFAGLQTLLNFAVSALHRRQHADGEAGFLNFVFCSSTASVANFSCSSPGELVPESIITDPNVSSPAGYSRSKWVAENICHQAALANPGLARSLSVVRVGQLSGDTVHGIWNKSEAYPLMLGTAEVTGCLPDLPDEGVAWLPVDKAAAAFVQLGLDDLDQHQGEGVSALHVLNQDTTTSWRMLLDWIRSAESFEVVPPYEWLERLEKLSSTDEEDHGENNDGHPALMLLDFWKQAYGGNGGGSGKEAAGPGLEIQRTIAAMPTLAEIKPVDREYALKLWKWIRETV
ncbi:Adenylate-forming reductase [Pseudocercospora fuligena]|uniref:Adenylate-forming reductase n=1 Tax=Pseudocercospora fuligena TaxID=685502 RepID=A0A8H6RKK9_9PEZI|nr:Adenylate-forming reductase [Pseudocercospora fuligena]